MTTCTVSVHSSSDKSIEQMLLSSTECLSSLFWFYDRQIYCFGSRTPLLSALFLDAAGSRILAKLSESTTIRYLSKTKQQTGKV